MASTLWARRDPGRHVPHPRRSAIIVGTVTSAATYVYQPRAFAAAVLRGEPVITNAEDAVANMRQIDSVYRAAGLPPRGRQD